MPFPRTILIVGALEQVKAKADEALAEIVKPNAGHGEAVRALIALSQMATNIELVRVYLHDGKDITDAN